MLNRRNGNSSLAEHLGQHCFRLREPLVGQDQRFRLTCGIFDQAFVVEAVCDRPVDGFPDTSPVVQRQAENSCSIPDETEVFPICGARCRHAR
jgi:hypothetical protein